MSHRQAGSVCLRACAHQGGWMPIVSPHRRRTESPQAEAQQRQPALPAVPHNLDLQLRAGSSVVSQSGKPFSVLPVVSLADPRLKLRRDLLQIGLAMNFFQSEVMEGNETVTREGDFQSADGIPKACGFARHTLQSLQWCSP